MLTKRYAEQISSLLIPADKWRLFDPIEKRDTWESIPGELRQSCIAKGEDYLGFEYPMLPATSYMEYSLNGNRSRYERKYFERRTALTTLVIAELMEARGRFINDIINGIWCICEESAWWIPAHDYVASTRKEPLPDKYGPGIDLFAAETAQLLTLTYHMLKSSLDKVSPVICERIEKELQERILDPYLERDDFWWMNLKDTSHVNNWNPWCTSNCLTAFLIMEKDPDRRNRAVSRAMRSLDSFLASYHEDGGCDEGTSYWTHAGGSLFDCLELLYSASAGKINIYGEPLVKEIGRYIYRCHISGDYFINFADGGAEVWVDGALVYRYGQRISDPAMTALGAEAFKRRHRDLKKRRRSCLLRDMRDIFGFEEIMSYTSEPSLPKDVWMPGIQVMAARQQENSDRGLYLAAKGGHNGESHNHNDIGQFIVYADGKPMIIDAGVGEYTAKTFSPNRYEIWTMQSSFHNIPEIKGVQQKDGKQYKAGDVSYALKEDGAELSLDLAPAYPAQAGIEQWKRSLRMVRGNRAHIRVDDCFRLKDAGEVVMHLMTPWEPVSDEEGNVRISCETTGVRIVFDSPYLETEVQRIDLEDRRLSSCWGPQLFRIILKAGKIQGDGKLGMRIEQI